MLAACSAPVRQTAPEPTVDLSRPIPPADPPWAQSGDEHPLPPAIQRTGSRWVPVRWADLPGFVEDSLHEAWNAWLRSCERPGPVWAPLCPEVRQLSIASADEQRQWMTRRLQPYRVEALDSASDGLLTGYYEPLLDASRQPRPGFAVPLHRPPTTLGQRKPWYSRQEIDTVPAAQEALRGREIAWLADPVQVLALHIQGSGRLRITEPDGSVRTVRVAFAGTNDQPYRSVGRWLLDQNLVRDATWPGIQAWAQANPQRAREMLWANPRYVFFREEPLSELDASFGPRGAQGVALTPGRSIAVDPQSLPYGTPVWLATQGPQLNLRRLVLAQDTGSAIVGAVRADYFTGWGAQAGEVAGRLKQPLQLWALWPR